MPTKVEGVEAVAIGHKAKQPMQQREGLARVRQVARAARQTRVTSSRDQRTASLKKKRGGRSGDRRNGDEQVLPFTARRAMA